MTEIEIAANIAMKFFFVLIVISIFAPATSTSFINDNYEIKLFAGARSLSIAVDVAVHSSPGSFFTYKFCDK